MILHETDTVLFFWTAMLTEDHDEWPLGTRGGDWLCILAVTQTGELKGEYRFRYSAGPGFDERDVINRYEFKGPDEPDMRERAIAACREMSQLEGFEHVVETEVNGNADALQAAMLNHPGLMVRALPEDKSADLPPTQRGAST